MQSDGTKALAHLAIRVGESERVVHVPCPARRDGCVTMAAESMNGDERVRAVPRPEVHA